jgi:hypothetical protein
MLCHVLFDKAEDSLGLQNLQQGIETALKDARIMKEREWKESSSRYEALTQNICSTTSIEKHHADGSHDIRGLEHCFVIKCRRRLTNRYT